MQKNILPPSSHGLIWITGLSGAGKTTIAKQLIFLLRSNGVNPVWLDGDTLRKALLIDGGYSRDDRLKIARRYCNLAKTFVNQNHLVVCSTISLFYEIHEWNRTNISPYLEVFLDVPEPIRARRDTQGHFRGIGANEVTDFAGSHIMVDFPKTPDLHIQNFGDNNVEDTIAIIWKKMAPFLIFSE